MLTPFWWRTRDCLNVVGAVLVFSCFGDGVQPSVQPITSGTSEEPRVGLASWYSEYDPGVTPLTANGEAFQDEALTAASWELPFNSCIQVTNLLTFDKVVVRVNDRGPHKRLVLRGRIIDLSRAAFEQLADLQQGLIPVQIDPAPHCPESAYTEHREIIEQSSRHGSS